MSTARLNAAVKLVHDTHTRQAMWSRAIGSHHQALFAVSAVALAAALALEVRRVPAGAAAASPAHPPRHGS